MKNYKEYLFESKETFFNDFGVTNLFPKEKEDFQKISENILNDILKFVINNQFILYVKQFGENITIIESPVPYRFRMRLDTEDTSRIKTWKEVSDIKGNKRRTPVFHKRKKITIKYKDYFTNAVDIENQRQYYVLRIVFDKLFEMYKTYKNIDKKYEFRETSWYDYIDKISDTKYKNKVILYLKENDLVNDIDKKYNIDYDVSGMHMYEGNLLNKKYVPKPDNSKEFYRQFRIPKLREEVVKRFKEEGLDVDVISFTSNRDVYQFVKVGPHNDTDLVYDYPNHGMSSTSGFVDYTKDYIIIGWEDTAIHNSQHNDGNKVQPYCVIKRPGIEEYFDTLKEALDFAVTLFITSDFEIFEGNLFKEKIELTEDEIKYFCEDFVKILNANDVPANLHLEQERPYCDYNGYKMLLEIRLAPIVKEKNNRYKIRIAIAKIIEKYGVSIDFKHYVKKMKRDVTGSKYGMPTILQETEEVYDHTEFIITNFKKHLIVANNDFGILDGYL